MEPHWRILEPPDKIIRSLVTQLPCHPTTALVLANRGITTPAQAHQFISDGLGQLPSPFCVKDIDTAARRIHAAIQERERILIFGDYDVDGVTATAMLVTFLSGAGAQVDYYIPHRTREGYGLKPGHIEEVARPRNIALVVTVDCGIASHDAIELANQAGIDVIVTDHHRVGDSLPPAAAVINPQRTDCDANLKLLSGAGVAFYLLIYLRKLLRDNQFWQGRPEPSLKRICDLAALGAIADMMPMTGANRILVKAGLARLNSNPRPGLAALIRISRLTVGTVDAEDLTFRLVPRLNAAGRMGHANSAVRLLITTRGDQAEHLAHTLDRQNQNRRSIEEDMVAGIVARLKANPELSKSPALVLAADDWHEGVLGIAAARIMRRYHRHVVLIALREGRGRGSGRSIPGFDLYRALCNCAGDLKGFGGHAMAAGLEIAPAKVDQFRQNLAAAAAREIPVEGARPELAIDGELPLDRIDHGLMDELTALAPFGSNNPEPLFMTRDVKVASYRKVGTAHRRLTLEQNGTRMEAMHFNVDTARRPPSHLPRVAFRLKWNHWQGVRRPQILLAAV